ncbi:MAG: hypothetical protein LBV36_00325 [Chromatiales bacterium]|jgi:hypothetical protein|nr:hypothetical protein [Chromatiales bacterium]
MRAFVAISSIAVAAALLACPPVRAQEAEARQWGISPFLGLYSPSLKALNRGLFRAPFEGTAQFIDPSTSNQESSFLLEMPLEPLNPSPMAGLEIQWRHNDRNLLLFGVGTWQARSSVSGVTIMPIQGALENIDAQRNASLSYTEFYLGWRHVMRSEPGKYRLYLAGTLHQMYDINYREDFTTIFLSGDARSFRKTSVTLAQTTGAVLLQGTAGGEWFISNRISLGLEGSYDLGIRKMDLGNAQLLTDFLTTDNVIIHYPGQAGDNGRMQYKTGPDGEYRDLKLDFSGWKAAIKATYYF